MGKIIKGIIFVIVIVYTFSSADEALKGEGFVVSFGIIVVTIGFIYGAYLFVLRNWRLIKVPTFVDFPFYIKTTIFE